MREKNNFKVCVFGDKEVIHASTQLMDTAKKLGRELALSGAVLLVGANEGFSYWVAMGAKEAGAMVIGFSPAISEKEHVEIYKLPVDYMDMVIYSGFGFEGRDMLMVRSADAVILGKGKVSALHEFVLALESHKPVGILEGSWGGKDDIFKLIVESKPEQKITFSESSEDLVKETIKAFNK